MIDDQKLKGEFLEKAFKIHGNKYDYSKVEYVNSKTKVCIICPIHGEFYQEPRLHISGCGCKQCATNKKKYFLNEKTFIEQSQKKHNNKYDYSKVEYINNSTKVCIICPIHGEFWQSPDNHYMGKGCPKCNGGTLYTKDIFLSKSQQIHNNKYDYSKVNYINSKTKVIITCPIHGDFEQTPSSHLNGNGCPKCANVLKKTVEQFINESNKIHNNKYNYSKVNYINSKTKVIITCPIHGDFEQIPSSHLKGVGCPCCKESHLERDIANFLIENEIKFIRQKKFSWLNKQSLDFYIPEYNVAIECQGEQHFKCSKTSSFFNEEKVEKIKKLDDKKKMLCDNNYVKLLYFSDLQVDTPYYVFNSKEELLQEIKKS